MFEVKLGDESAPVQAAEKAAVHKCDKAGNACTEGRDCSAAHCKAKKKSTTQQPKQ